MNIKRIAQSRIPEDPRKSQLGKSIKRTRRFDRLRKWKYGKPVSASIIVLAAFISFMIALGLSFWSIIFALSSVLATFLFMTLVVIFLEWFFDD